MSKDKTKTVSTKTSENKFTQTAFLVYQMLVKRR